MRILHDFSAFNQVLREQGRLQSTNCLCLAELLKVILEIKHAAIKFVLVFPSKVRVSRATANNYKLTARF
jgi:hypothetical protein